MKPVDILYFIEHVSRELDIACIVKYLCETKYGLSVEITSLPLEVNSVIHQYQPHIIIVPYFYSVESAGIPPIIKHWKNLTYLNLNYEQFFSKANQKFKAPKDSFVRNEVYQHAWGEFFKEFLIENDVKEANIFVNGNPSYMLYLEPYCNYFPTRSDIAKKYKLKEEKLWLFFPENYGWAFLSDAEIESHIREGYDPKIAYENREFNQKSLKEIIRWFNHIAQNTNIEIIVRPRPAVSENEYINEFEKELDKIPQSIHIIKEGSIREWNLASDIIVSSFSTSLLEAAVANNPTYIFEPYPFPDWLHGDWYDLIPHIKSLEELESICCQEIDPSSSQRARDYVMQTSLSRGDAIANIARILYDLRQARSSPARYVRSRRQPHAVMKKLLGYATLIKSFLNKKDELGYKRAIRTALKFLFRGATTNSEYTRFEDDKFTEKDVNERTKRWAMVLTSYKDGEVKKG